MKITQIVFATDFSEGSLHALPYAVDMAKQYDASLYMVHVIYDVTRTTGWYVPHRGAMGEAILLYTGTSALLPQGI